MAKRVSEVAILRQIPLARKRAEVARVAGLRADSAHLDWPRRRIEFEMSDGAMFALPLAKVPGLEAATRHQVGDMELSPSGSVIHFPSLDADYSVAGLLLDVIGRTAALQEAGRSGGRAATKAKKLAARENGKKGGRPRSIGVKRG